MAEEVLHFYYYYSNHQDEHQVEVGRVLAQDPHPFQVGVDPPVATPVVVGVACYQRKVDISKLSNAHFHDFSMKL